MKIRTDFVTNSSSSLFTIACNKELSRETLYEAFQIPEEHPLREFLEMLFSTIMIEAKEETEDDIRRHIKGGYGDPADRELYESIVDKGFKHFYSGSFFSSGHQWVTAEQYLSKFNLPTVARKDAAFISKEGKFYIAGTEPVTEEKLFELFQIPSSHPLREYFSDFVKGIHESIQYWNTEKDLSDEDKKTIRLELKQLREKHDLDTDKFKYFYAGEFTSEEDFFDDQYLCFARLSIKSDDFVMFKVFAF